MWVLPKNYQLSSAFAADMVESKEDLTLQGLNIESSLMWRSKPSPLRTWSTRWKEGSYLPHLYTRILKPSQRSCFEAALTSSLAVIRASRFQQQDSERELMTQDTCGRILGDTLNQLDLFDASLKTSRDTSRLDSPVSSAIWKKMVIDQRGEYLARVKSALLTRESEFLSWATPRACSAMAAKITEKTSMAKYPNLETQIAQGVVWATPTAADWKNMDTASQVMLSKQVKMWPTPTAHLGKEGGYPAEYTRNTPSLTAVAMKSEQRPHSSGYLNPNWVEWLMGVPTGWTDLGSWETE